MVSFLTEKELGAIIRRSCVTLRKWRATGAGPRWVRVGGRILYPTESTKEWLRVQAASAGSAAPEDREGL